MIERMRKNVTDEQTAIDDIEEELGVRYSTLILYRPEGS